MVGLGWFNFSNFTYKMFSNNSPFRLLYVIIILIQFSNVTTTSKIASFHDLLGNLSHCDLQIMHSLDYSSLLSLSDINMVSTNIYLPDYEFKSVYTGYELNLPPALDILNSRVSYCRLGFIFVGPGATNINTPLPDGLHQWIHFTSTNFLYLKEFMSHSRYKTHFIPNTNAVVSLVINKLQFPQIIKFLFPEPLFYFLSIIVTSQGNKFELYFPEFMGSIIELFPHVKSLPEIYLSEGNYVSTVEKQTPQWARWCILEFRKASYVHPKVETEIVGTILYRLTLQIFAKANISVIYHPRCYNFRTIQVQFDAANPPTNIGVTIIQRSVGGYQFLTCYTEPYITLGFYLTPFQPELWLVLVITIAILIAVMTLCQRFLGLLKQQTFSAWLYVLASLFEETGSIPTWIEKHTFFRILLGVWGILTVVLTNGYNGIMISELNSPRAQSYPVSFNQLDCQNKFKMALKLGNIFEEGLPKLAKQDRNVRFAHLTSEFWNAFWVIRKISISVPLNWMFSAKIDINDTSIDSECYRLLSQLDPDNGIQVLPEFLSVLLNLGYSFFYSVTSSKSSNLTVFRELNLFSLRHSFYPKGFSYLSNYSTYSALRRRIEGEVVQCGKTVFIGKSSAIKVEYEFLAKKYPDINFFVSTQTVQSNPTGMLFRHAWTSPVLGTFKNLNEAGILTLTENQELRRININRTASISMEKSKALKPKNIATLSGTLPTVFILMGSLIGVSIPVFIIECRRRVGLLITNVFILVRFRLVEKLSNTC